jgi:hypothetical protein
MGAFPLIATVAQGAVSYLGKKSLADAQEAQYQANAKAAGDASVVKAQEMNETYQRNMEVLSGQDMDNQLASIRNQASLEAAASEGGVGGKSIKSLILQEQAFGLHQATAIKQQADALKFNTILESKGITAETQNRINSVQRGTAPSLFTELGMAGLGYATSSLLKPEEAGKVKLEKIKIT